MNDTIIAAKAKEQHENFLVRLPMFPDRQLHLVVVKGFGQQPMMLLTSLPVDASFKSQILRREAVAEEVAKRAGFV